MTRQRVLVVDDEPGMLRSVERVLGPFYETQCSRSPLAALEMARTFEADLALLDVQMPELSGFELMERLKAERPDLDVIFMTGSINELDTQLVRAIRGRAFYFIQKPFDREVLLTLVGRCLDLRRLAAENRAHTERLEWELEQARVFQRSLLPHEHARLAGVVVDARYIPCARMGGDFYDFAAGPRGATILVADVSGHGVSAAMLTGIVKSAFHVAQAEGGAPLDVIERILDTVRPFGMRRFVTAFCARVRRDATTLEYVSAGHPPALLWGSGREMTLLEDTGPLISPGLAALDWEQREMALKRDDRLLIYTDGIEDVVGEGGTFGRQRLIDAAQRCADCGSDSLDRILAAARDFAGGRPEPDDVTLLHVCRASDGAD